MSKLIFSMIGLVLAMMTFACKRSKPPVAEIRPVSAHHLLPEAPEMTLESGLATEWTEIRVACARWVECAGTATGNSLLITRKDGRMMIGGSEEIALGKFRELPGRPLEKDEFDEIVNKLRRFYGLAQSERAEAKPFDSFPPEERKKELAAYYKLLGRPYLMSNSHIFYVQFEPDMAKMLVEESFTDPRSAQGYKNWLEKTWKGLEAVP
ncbi:MAG: hypothetical protein ACRDBP_19585 [Luteolibacter sp.]